MNIYIQLR